MGRSKFFVIVLVLSLAPVVARASVSSVLFTTSPQSIAPGTVSDVLTLGVQDETGGPVSGGVPQTGCIAVTTTSATGQFSSSATSWNPVGILTMNKGTSNRNFYYQDSTAGSYTLSAVFALKPTSVSTSCASWPQSQWGNTLTASQHITVGSASSGSHGTDQDSQPSTEPPEDFSEGSSTTSASTQEIVGTPSGVGSETLTASIKTEQFVVVGGGSFFVGSARDSVGAKIGDVRYLWNFGDGATLEGQSVFHAYRYPGQYATSLTVAAGDEVGMARTVVQALPADIGLLIEGDGSIVLVNHSPQEVNIGLWNITSGVRTFLIPLETILLGGKSLRFAPTTLQFWADDATTLRYPNNVIAAVVLSGGGAERAFAASSGDAKASSATSATASAESVVAQDVADAGSTESTSTAEGAPQGDGPRTEQFPSKEIAYPEAVTGAVGALTASTANTGFSSYIWLVPYVLGPLGLILICMAIVLWKAPKAPETPKAPHGFDI